MVSKTARQCAYGTPRCSPSDSGQLALLYNVLRQFPQRGVVEQHSLGRSDEREGARNEILKVNGRQAVQAQVHEGAFRIHAPCIYSHRSSPRSLAYRSLKRLPQAPKELVVGQDALHVRRQLVSHQLAVDAR